MRRRISLWESVAFAAVLASGPLAAQSTNQATPPPTPAPTPAPTGNSVGPPQLRDFNLNGTVTTPAQPDAPTTTPTPSPVPRASPAPTRTAPVRTAPAPRQPDVAAPDSDASPDEVTVDLPPSTTAPLEFEAPVVPAPVVDTPPATDAPGGTWWPWLAALFAVALGAGLLWRRHQQRGGERYGADHDALGALVAAPAAAPTPLPRVLPTPPRMAPRVPPSTPVPAPVPRLPPVAPTPDGIFASRLKPELAFELEPIRAEADAAEGAALTFDLIVFNRGSAPARDVLIEAQLINAGPQVDAAVGRFFNQAGGTGERLPMIAPMSRVSIRTRLGVAAADLAPLVVEGRKLFVPVVAINALYRWSGGDVKESSSFLVGRGETEGGKMAPFRLDRGARSWSDLAARLHSSGLAHCSAEGLTTVLARQYS